MRHPTHASRLALAALAMIAASGTLPVALAGGATAPRAVRFESVTIAAEVFAASVTLPPAAGGALVMPACAGCAAKSFPTDAATVYLLKDQPVTVAAMRAAFLEHPQSIVTVSYVVKTGLVTEVSIAL